MVIFITDSFLTYQQAPKNQYFNPQLEVLAAEGIHHFEIVWSDDEPTAESAAKLRDMIVKQAGPVILMGHGKGGLDALECLVRYPEVRSQVQRFVCIQAPIWGTPIADYLTGHPVMRVIAETACRFLGGNIKALEELSEMNRQVYMILNRAEISKVLSEVETITVGSVFQGVTRSGNWKDRLLKSIHRLVKKHAGDNDGIVPAQSTRIGSETHLLLSNVSHLGSVTFDNSPEFKEMTREVIKPMSLKPSVYQKPSLLDPSGGRNGLKFVRPSQLET